MSTRPLGNRSHHLPSNLRKSDSHSKQDLRHGAGLTERRNSNPTSERIPICSVTPNSTWYIPCKRGIDVVLSIVLLTILSPIMLLGALLVKLTSRGPAFYRQTRLGQNGRHFTILKLRTMREDAESETGPVWSTGNDSRVTPLGKLLRDTHIDEFPQLLNVLRGDMSLIGPRPERPEIVVKLDWEIEHYHERLKVRPGITGLAQLYLGPDASIESVRRKVMHDLYYVRYLSPWLDAKLLFVTGMRLLKELYRFAWKCITLPSPNEIEIGFLEALGLREPEPEVVAIPSRPSPMNDKDPKHGPERAEVCDQGA